jgi:hypothetical protein
MRRYAIRAGLAAALALSTLLLTLLRVPALTDDFMASWSAARLLLRGANLYDPSALLAIQNSQGRHYPISLPSSYGP